MYWLWCWCRRLWWRINKGLFSRATDTKYSRAGPIREHCLWGKAVGLFCRYLICPRRNLLWGGGGGSWDELRDPVALSGELGLLPISSGKSPDEEEAVAEEGRGLAREKLTASSDCGCGDAGAIVKRAGVSISQTVSGTGEGQHQQREDWGENVVDNQHDEVILRQFNIWRYRWAPLMIRWWVDICDVNKIKQVFKYEYFGKFRMSSSKISWYLGSSSKESSKSETLCVRVRLLA